MGRGKFIIIEGIDGAGKSTVTKWISENFPYEFHKTPGGAFAKASSYFNADRVTAQERFSFYCGENIRASQYVSEQVSKGVNVVVDRYYLSTISYHRFLYPDIYENYKNIFKVLYKPDLAVIVQTELSVIESRMKNLNLEPNDKFYLNSQYYKNIYNNLFDAAGFLSIPLFVLDNNSDFIYSQNVLQTFLVTNNFV